MNSQLTNLFLEFETLVASEQFASSNLDGDRYEHAKEKCQAARAALIAYLNDLERRAEASTPAHASNQH